MHRIVRAASRLLTILVCLSAVCLIDSPRASGQEITASVSGTITDSSGAVITGASVKIHNNGTGADRTVSADGSGVYHATLLPVGTYTLTFSAKGFQSYVAEKVVLHVGDHRTLDATMQAGAVTQSVTVTATATPLDLGNASQEQTITGHQIQELELNNRNFEQLVVLQPGVSSQLPDQVGFGLQNTTAVSINGARTTANNWTVDGSDINDSGSNATLLNVPSVDALQEFKIGRSTYDAQYGRSGGGQINVMTKAGTNQFHGDAYEFDRNSVFNATPFLTNSVNGTKPPFTYNDFGFTVGGPIYVPNHYNTDKTKTFFFWSEEWRRTDTPQTPVAVLPPAQELQGNFQGITTLNPALAPAGCITNNVISTGCFSKNAQVYIQNIYSKFTPNSGNELITSQTAINNYRQDIVRLDENLNSKVQIFARYMGDNVPTTEPGGLFSGEPLPGISSTATVAPGRNIVAHVTAEIDPQTVNEAAFNYSWGAIDSAITGIIDQSSFLSALTNQLPYTDPYGRIPGVGITGITGVGIPSAPYHERNVDKEIYDNLSHVIGNHSVRVGADWQIMRKSENGPLPTNGSFTFHSANGLPSFANFLLGNAAVFSQANRDIIPDLHFINFEAYGQDDWKLKPNLTLNFGVRYSFFPAPHDINGILDNFSPQLFNSANAPQIDPTTGRFVAGGITPAGYLNGIIVGKNGCAGASSGGSTATCSPYGNQVNPNNTTNFAPRFGFAWDPFKTGKTSIRGGYGIYYDRSLNGIWEQNQFADPPFVQSLQLLSASFDNPSNGVPPASILAPRALHVTGTPGFPTENVQDWNFSVQRELMSNTELEVAYVGSKGTNLLGLVDLNQVPAAARLANPTLPANSLRPYVGYGPMSTIANYFNSEYNSLQVSLNRRMTRGLTLGAAYTWSNCITNNATDRSSAIYDTYNPSLDYGPCGYNRGQILQVNYVYDLPFFQGRNDLTGRTLGGWEVSGISSFYTGLPLTAFQFNDPFDSIAGSGIGIDPSAVSPRPNRVQGQPITGPKTAASWFNVGGFTDATGYFGTASRGQITGPGLGNWDIALMKNITITERLSGQLRGEFFNAFNDVSFLGVQTNIDAFNAGRVTSTHDPRIIQLGFKLYF